MKKSLFLVFTIGLGVNACFADVAECLQQAYPDIASVKNNTIYFKSGNQLPIGQVSNQPFTQRLKNASVADQL